MQWLWLLQWLDAAMEWLDAVIVVIAVIGRSHCGQSDWTQSLATETLIKGRHRSRAQSDPIATVEFSSKDRERPFTKLLAMISTSYFASERHKTLNCDHTKFKRTLGPTTFLCGYGFSIYRKHGQSYLDRSSSASKHQEHRLMSVFV